MRVLHSLSRHHVQRLSAGSGLPLSGRVKHRHTSCGIRAFSLGPGEINSYTASQCPTYDQLKEASRFFTKQKPTLLFSSPTFRLLPASSHPEVTFLGRSNVGKSSLINSLLNRNGVAQISKKPGKTRLMNAYGVSPNPLSEAKQSGTKGEFILDAWKRMRGGLLLVDMPGYGHASRKDWGDEIIKYLRQRKQLRRVFVLIDSEHGIKKTDRSILERLVENGVPHSLVFSKVDKLFDTNGKEMTDIKLENRARKVRDVVEATKTMLSTELYGGRPVPGDILCVSSVLKLQDGGFEHDKLGIAALRHAILSACGLGAADMLSRGINISDIKIIEYLPGLAATQ